MLGYTLRRLLIAVPTLGLITVLAFLLTQAGTDPARATCTEKFNLGKGNALSALELDSCIMAENRAQGRDLPYFYFSLRPWAEPLDRGQYRGTTLRHWYGAWLATYGCWPEVKALQQALQGWTEHLAAQGSDQGQALEALTRHFALRGLPADYPAYAAAVQQYLKTHKGLHPHWREVQVSHEAVRAQAQPWRYYLPKLRWHGTQSQYHQWLRQFFFEGGGYSRHHTRETVMERLVPKLLRTLSYALPGLVLILLLGTGLGLWAAIHPLSRGDQLLAGLSFGLRAVPAFWLAQMLYTLFSDPEMGMVILYMEGAVEAKKTEGPRFLLIMALYTYGGITLVARLMRNRLLELSEQDFLRTARAKGLTRAQALRRHGLRHALLIVATLLGSSLPALISGSVVIEKIFHIRGVGLAALEAATLGNDAPMMMAIFTLTGVLTLLGYLVSDLLYAWLDPRIELSQPA